MEKIFNIMDKNIKKLEAIKTKSPDPSDIDVLKEGILAIRCLINNSEGVAGLHLNGDIAKWSDLEEGGFFESWLTAFNQAELVE